MNLAGHRVRRLSGNYSKPWTHAFRCQVRSPADIGQIIRHVRMIFSGSKDWVRRELNRAFNRDLKRDVCSEERISRGRAFHRGQTQTKYDSWWVETCVHANEMNIELSGSRACRRARKLDWTGNWLKKSYPSPTVGQLLVNNWPSNKRQV